MAADLIRVAVRDRLSDPDSRISARYIPVFQRGEREEMICVVDWQQGSFA